MKYINRVRCVRGHTLDEHNTYFTKNGSYICKKCRNIKSKEYRYKASVKKHLEKINDGVNQR